MKYLWFCIFTIWSEMMYSQSYSLGGESKWNNMKLPVSCNLQLLKDNRYSITFSVSQTIDIIHCSFISYGTYQRKGSLYYLKDVPSGTEIVLEERKHSNLLVKKGFCFMKNDYFFYYANYTDHEINNLERERKKRNEQEIVLLNNRRSDSIPLQLGTYRNGNISLTLGTDYGYKAYFWFDNDFPFLISEGKWSKKGNELKLYDPCLDYAFLALIMPDRLNMIRFPNDFSPNGNFYLIK